MSRSNSNIAIFLEQKVSQNLNDINATSRFQSNDTRVDGSGSGTPLSTENDSLGSPCSTLSNTRLQSVNKNCSMNGNVEGIFHIFLICLFFPCSSNYLEICSNLLGMILISGNIEVAEEAGEEHNTDHTTKTVIINPDSENDFEMAAIPEGADLRHNVDKGKQQKCLKYSTWRWHNLSADNIQHLLPRFFML